MCGGGDSRQVPYSHQLSHPAHTDLMSLLYYICPIDFPFTVPLLCSPYIPQKWSLLPFYTPAHIPHQGTPAVPMHTLPGGRGRREALLARSGQR